MMVIIPIGNKKSGYFTYF